MFIFNMFGYCFINRKCVSVWGVSVLYVGTEFKKNKENTRCVDLSIQVIVIKHT